MKKVTWLQAFKKGLLTTAILVGGAATVAIPFFLATKFDNLAFLLLMPVFWITALTIINKLRL